MKTRKLLIVILVIALLAVYYILGTDYLRQRREREALATQIAGATQTLAQVPPSPADLEPRLTAARTDLAAARNAFPGRLNSTQIVNAVLKLADDIGVKAVPLVTQPWTTESVNDSGYSVFRLNVAITGTLTQLESFLSELENGELGTLVVEHLAVDKTSESPGEANAPEDNTPVNASLDIAIYTQAPTNE